MTLLFCDIETLPTTDMEVIAEIAASIKPPGTIKKPESVAAWMAQNSWHTKNDPHASCRHQRQAASHSSWRLNVRK